MTRLSHGHNRKGQRTPTYRAWAAAKNRCRNPTNNAYTDYGGRGIGMCRRWWVFENFLADMGERPSGTTLDRIDNDYDYRPGNCRWATRKAQARNRRSSRVITINGVSRTVAEWCELNGVRQGTAQQRIHAYGWTPEEAVTLPRQK